MPRHIHADAIIAWAGGAQIQQRLYSQPKWHDIAYPVWNHQYDYRVKPEPVTATYRLALMKGTGSNKPYVYANSREGLTEATFEASPSFIRWLGNSVTVEV